ARDPATEARARGRATEARATEVRGLAAGKADPASGVLGSQAAGAAAKVLPPKVATPDARVTLPAVSRATPRAARAASKAKAATRRAARAATRRAAR
ncbi:MAG TPA: hypothetical protein DEA08_32780, partial [Planctomycetes bacterium]|nr:hypothetical protein [Planctomycetota bacterium]